MQPQHSWVYKCCIINNMYLEGQQNTVALCCWHLRCRTRTTSWTSRCRPAVRRAPSTPSGCFPRGGCDLVVRSSLRLLCKWRLGAWRTTKRRAERFETRQPLTDPPAQSACLSPTRLRITPNAKSHRLVFQLTHTRQNYS